MNDIRTARELSVDSFDQIIDGWMKCLLVDEIVRAEEVNEVAGLLPEEFEFFHEALSLDMRRVNPMEHDLEHRDVSLQHSMKEWK
jgi:hypothetical protein